MNPTLQAATAYNQAGFSTIPIRVDGTKAPDGHLLPLCPDPRTGEQKRSWDPFKERLATAEEIARWWDRPEPSGIAIVGGEVSGRLLIIDVEYLDFFSEWAALVKIHCPGLLARLPLVRTPGKEEGGGRHVYARTAGPAVASAKLARIPKAEALRRTGDRGQTTAIEVKGQGGYVLAPGSPAACHKSSRLYEHIAGPCVPQTPTISEAEVRVLLDCARALERGDDASKDRPRPEAGGAAGNRPGDDFNRRADWCQDVLGTEWRVVRQNGDVLYVCRPGKEDGVSATIGHCKSEKAGPKLYVFSTNAEPFAPEKAYSKFEAYALLRHEGDFAAAARALGESGFGEQNGTSQRAMPSANGQTADGSAVVIVRASDVVIRPVEWLWPDRIPLGKMTTFAGVGGLGKTFVLCDIAARVSRGGEWPESGGECAEPGEVLFISGEDDPDDTLVPRMMECGADLNQICFLSPEASDSFNLSAISLLTKAVEQTGPNVRLVVVDPPSSYLGDKDEHKNAEVRSLLTPLKTWLARRRIAMIFNSHLTKGTGAKVDAMMRVMGSVAWVNAVRAAHLFVRDADDKGRVLFVPMKTNLGPAKLALAYRLKVVPVRRARVEWDKGEIDVSADQAMGGSRDTPRRALAVEWLAEMFREKLEWSSEDFWAAAKEHGVSKNAIDEARHRMGWPKARKHPPGPGPGGKPKWVWWVPADWDLLKDQPAQ